MKKGDRITYTGRYADGVPPYPPGTVVGFRTGRGRRLVRVRLDGVADEYAYWPLDEVAEAP
jgi:hypothetical protein